MQEVMKQGIMFLATQARADTAPLLPQLLKAPKSALQWKPMLVRLEVLEQLIPDVTVGKEKNQLPVRDVMDLLGAAAKNANGTVRAAAVRGIALVVQQVVRHHGSCDPDFLIEVPRVSESLFVT